MNGRIGARLSTVRPIAQVLHGNLLSKAHSFCMIGGWAQSTF